MKLSKSILKIAFILLITANALSASANATVKIGVSGLKSTNGNLIVTVFQNQEQFEKEKPYKVFTVSKKNMKSGKLFTSISLPAGDYGIVIVDDANANKKMDYKGPIPTEGFGFSNYELSGLRKPKLSNFKFSLTTDRSVAVKMRYI